MMKKEPLLTEEAKIEIRFAIQAKMDREDVHPNEIIKYKYGGNEEEYLLAMANWLKILV